MAIVQTSFTYTADGQSTLFQVPFDYLLRTDVRVHVDGDYGVAYTWSTNNSIRFEAAPSAGSTVNIHRRTHGDVLDYVFEVNAPFLPVYIDADLRQLLFLVQETSQRVDDEESRAEAAEAALQNSIDAGGDALKKERDERVAADYQEQQDRIAGDNTVRAELNAEIASLQEQLTGEVPIGSSAFSPISWHDQVVQNSVTIPDNKNAWSFGPRMRLADGVTVRVGDNSYWTIAN